MPVDAGSLQRCVIDFHIVVYKLEMLLPVPDSQTKVTISLGTGGASCTPSTLGCL